MATAVQELREMVKHIEDELNKVKDRLIALELPRSKRHAKAAKDWLALTKKTKGKWASDSPSSIELSRLRRRHA